MITTSIIIVGVLLLSFLIVALSMIFIYRNELISEAIAQEEDKLMTAINAMSKNKLEPREPCGRLVYERDEHRVGNKHSMCPECGSSLSRKFFGLVRTGGCIQPKCPNWYMRDNRWKKGR